MVIIRRLDALHLKRSSDVRFLRELRALFAEGLASDIRHTMFRLDAFPIRAIVVVVVHFPVFGRIFR